MKSWCIPCLTADKIQTRDLDTYKPPPLTIWELSGRVINVLPSVLEGETRIGMAVKLFKH